MKRIVLIILLFLTSHMFSQRERKYEIDSLFIKQIVLFDKEFDGIVIYDSLGLIIVISKNENNYSAYKYLYERKNGIQLTKENIIDIKKLYNEIEILNRIYERDCFAEAHSIYKVSIMICKGDSIQNMNFMSNCKLDENLQFVKRLYYSLKLK